MYRRAVLTPVERIAQPTTSPVQTRVSRPLATGYP